MAAPIGHVCLYLLWRKLHWPEDGEQACSKLCCKPALCSVGAALVYTPLPRLLGVVWRCNQLADTVPFCRNHLLGAWGFCRMHIHTTHSMHGEALQHVAAAQGFDRCLTGFGVPLHCVGVQAIGPTVLFCPNHLAPGACVTCTVSQLTLCMAERCNIWLQHRAWYRCMATT